MPSIEACMTWSIAVDPVLLGAHFEAYCNTRSLTHTIRLCQRFGKGEHAAVTRLPVELVTMIEQYIIEHERKRQREAWSKDFRCWATRCTWTDHFSAPELVDMYNDYEVGKKARKEKLSAKQMKRLKKYVAEDFFGMSEAIEDIEEEVHDSRKDSWCTRVGYSAEVDRGVFSTHVRVFVQDFGLRTWISHSQRPVDQKDYDPDTKCSTVAFLIMPDAGKVTQDFNRRHPEERDDDFPPLPTEHGCGLVTAPPKTPSEKSLARFPRAMRMLALTAMKNSKPVLHASGEDVEDGKAKQDQAHEPGPDGRTDKEEDAVPVLRVLMASKDDMQDI